MSIVIRFTVPGCPRPGGSKVPQVVRKGDGSIVYKDGRPLVIVRDDAGKEGKIWRSLVADAAQEAHQGRPLLRGVARRPKQISGSMRGWTRPARATVARASSARMSVRSYTVPHIGSCTP